MKKLIVSAFFAILLFSACKLPNARNTVSEMEKYWRFFKVENYDSLKTFYIPKGDNPEQHYNELTNVLHAYHTKYGEVKQIHLTQTSVTSSLSDGETIELTYEVEYDKKTITHEFGFKKVKDGSFRIFDQTFSE